MVSSNQPISYEITTAGDDIQVVNLSGSLCEDGIDVTRQVMTDCISERPARLALRMADVSYISSSGIGMLVSVLKRCHQSGVDFAVCELTPDLFELFTLTRLDQVFTVATSVEAWQKSMVE